MDDMQSFLLHMASSVLCGSWRAELLKGDAD